MNPRGNCERDLYVFPCKIRAQFEHIDTVIRTRVEQTKIVELHFDPKDRKSSVQRKFNLFFGLLLHAAAEPARIKDVTIKVRVMC